MRIDNTSNIWDDKFEDYSNGKYYLTQEQWEELLAEKGFFTANMLDLLGKIYLSPNHATTCYRLGKIYNIAPQSFNGPVSHTGKKIVERFGFEVNKRERGNKYWPALFLGKYAEDEHFVWKLRPELERVLEKNPDFSASIPKQRELLATRLAASFSDEDIRIMAREDEKANRDKRHETPYILSQTRQYIRSPYISEAAKRLAKGKCALCGNDAPFKDKNNKPYLEAHHIIPLSDGGLDVLDNVVALCPNCHRKIHSLQDHKDAEKLRSYISSLGKY